MQKMTAGNPRRECRTLVGSLYAGVRRAVAVVPGAADEKAGTGSPSRFPSFSRNRDQRRGTAVVPN
jgi:hypothetical protein